MKRKFIYPLVIIIVTAGLYYSEDLADIDVNNAIVSNDSGLSESYSEEFDSSFLPSSSTGVVISHDSYTFSYSEDHEQAEWVAYELKQEDLSNNTFERPYFNEDKKVKTRSADWRNYKNSGYDRGHLCPAGDRKYSYDAYTKTFTTRNVNPQNPATNA